MVVVVRAAKFSLLNFFSLFRDLQKRTRFGGGGGFFVISKSRPDSMGGGGSSRNFQQWYSWGDTHFGKYDKNRDILRKNNRSIKFSQFREIFLQFRETWRSCAISGDSRKFRETWQVCVDGVSHNLPLFFSRPYRMHFFNLFSCGGLPSDVLPCSHTRYAGWKVAAPASSETSLFFYK